MQCLDHYVQVNGSQIRYWDEGQGDVPLILVHGFAACIEHWQYNISVLSNHHRVIAVDLIGFGKSDKPKINYTLRDFTLFLKAFLEILQIRTAVLIGHSIGGSISLAFALDYPEMVKKLVLIAPPAFTQKIPLAYRLLCVPYMDKILPLVRWPELCMLLFRRAAYRKERLSKALLQIIYEYNRSPESMAVLRHLMQANSDWHGLREEVFFAIKNRLKTLTIPVLLMWGRRDSIIPVSSAEVGQQLIPQAELCLFDDCGHLVQIEMADEFNARVEQFLASIDDPVAMDTR